MDSTPGATLKTALHGHHLKAGAKMAPFAGFDMPLQYAGSVKEEVHSTRNEVAVFDVSHMGEFLVEGKEACHYIDYLLPNHFLSAPIGKAVYSPLCRENGSIIDDLIAYKLGPERVLVCVNAANIEKDWSWFETQVGNFDCQLKNISEETSLLAIQGPKTEEALRKALDINISDLDYYGVREFGDYIIARTGYTGEDGVEVFASSDNIVGLWEKLMAEEIRPAGLVARDVLRLEVGYPLYGNELTDMLTPLDCGLKWTVKFEKEKFMGKDFLMDYQPKRQNVKFSVAKGIPRKEQIIVDKNGDEIGEVTSGTMSFTAGKGIGMASMDRENYQKGEQYFLQIRNKLEPLEVHGKPIVSGGHK